MKSRTRTVIGYAAVLVVLAGIGVARNRGAGDPGDVYTDIAPVPAAETTLLTAPPSTARPVPVTVPAAPASTTEEARPYPATTAAPTETDTVTAVAVAFLHAWVLRGTWDERDAALKDIATPEERDLVVYIDPDRVGLPPGQAITVDPARVTVTEAGGATVPAIIDGLAVTVHEVRTGAGWRVDTHGRG